MISKVRNYIINSINAIDSDLKQIDQFYESDIPEGLSNGSYFIDYEISTIEQSQQMITNNVALTVKFYFDAYRDRTVAYDSAMDKVNLISLYAANTQNIEAYSSTDETKIINVKPISQTSEILTDNSRQIVITASFEMIINQTTC